MTSLPANKPQQIATFREQANQMRQSLTGQAQTDSAILIREDRDQ